MWHQRLVGRWILVGVVGAVAMAGGESARAQATGPGSMPPDPKLLLIDGVRKELKLSDVQAGKVSTVAQEFVESLEKGFAEISRATLDVREIRQMRAALNQDLSAEAWSKLKGVLTEGQLTRIRQLDLRHLGMFAFLNPAVLRSLNATEDQKRELRAILEKAVTERPSFRNFQSSRPGATQELWLAAVEEVDERALARMIELLSQEQRKRWAEMIGPAYRFRVGE